MAHRAGLSLEQNGGLVVEEEAECRMKGAMGSQEDWRRGFRGATSSFVPKDSDRLGSEHPLLSAACSQRAAGLWRGTCPGPLVRELGQDGGGLPGPSPCAWVPLPFWRPQATGFGAHPGSG